jgi:hypothetical protein
MTYTKPEPGMPSKIDVAGRTLELRFTLRTLRDLQKDHGISVLDPQTMGQMFQDPERLALMLYYGVRNSAGTGPEPVTLEWIEDNFDASMLIDLAPMLAYATTGRWPDMSKLLGDVPNAPRPGATGLNSGPSDDTTYTLVNGLSGD